VKRSFGALGCGRGASGRVGKTKILIKVGGRQGERVVVNRAGLEWRRAVSLRKTSAFPLGVGVEGTHGSSSQTAGKLFDGPAQTKIERGGVHGGARSREIG